MSTPLTIKLTPYTLARADGLVRLLARRGVGELTSAFAFRNVERAFARQLLRSKPHLWVYRCNQRAFCGDFLVLDMSAQQARRRRVWALDLKMGAPLRRGAGPAGVSLSRVPDAVDEIATRSGAIPRGQVAAKMTGGAAPLLDYFEATFT